MDEFEQLKKQNQELQYRIIELESEVVKLTRMKNQALAVIFTTAFLIFISVNT
jgi:hypothetical protein